MIQRPVRFGVAIPFSFTITWGWFASSLTMSSEPSYCPGAFGSKRTPDSVIGFLRVLRDDLPVKAWADLDKPAVRIAVPQASSMDKFLSENVAKAQIDALEKALDQYRLDTGHYPSTELGLAALVQRPTNEPKWGGPYLRKDVPLDPWGKPYVYKTPGEKGGDFDLVSYGKDGQPGGTGENADITNH